MRITVIILNTGMDRKRIQTDFNPDSDPAFQLNHDPDTSLNPDPMRIQIQNRNFEDKYHLKLIVKK
jgi:hypothetical protein